MTTTPRLGLTLMTSATEQQYATYSESMKMIDGLINPYVQDFQTTPPVSPAEGDMYVVTATATGAWLGQEDNVAFYIQAGWIFLTPTPGLIVWDVSATAYKKWTGTIWEDTLSTAEFGGFHTGVPASMEMIAFILFANDIIIPADCAGSKGHVLVNPTASYAMDLRKNDVSVGTITVATDGTFTFSTSATPITLTAGDYISVIGNVTADATIDGIAFAFKGVK